jgi:DNA-binding transcriptional ArsR family regulator
VLSVTDLIRLDATALRVLAHPLRSRLLSQLRLHGPATATELANRLDTNTGASSYHLRKLEKIGLVADTGTGEGKRRVWEATSRGHEWQPSDSVGDEDAEASLSWLNRFYQASFEERVERWTELSRDWPATWRDTLGPGDDSVTVTADQARAMWDEIQQVVRRYRDAGTGDVEAIRVLVWTHLLPLDARSPASLGSTRSTARHAPRRTPGRSG